MTSRALPLTERCARVARANAAANGLATRVDSGSTGALPLQEWSSPRAAPRWRVTISYMSRVLAVAGVLVIARAASSAPAPSSRAATREPPHVIDVASESQTIVTAAAFADDGSLVVAGTYFGRLTIGKLRLAARRSGWQDAFVARIDRAGKVTWLAHAPTGDTVSAIAIGPHGAIALAGSVTSIVGKEDGPATRYRSRATAALIAADGKVRWQREFSSTDRAWTNSVTFAGDAVVACGAFAGTATFGGKQVDSIIGWPGRVPTVDAFVAQIAADGKLAWFATGGGEEDDTATACAALPSGDVAVVGAIGHRASFGAVQLVGPDASAYQRMANPTRVFVATYAATGALRSAIELGQHDFAAAVGVATLDDGTVIVRGTDEDIQMLDRHPFIARVVGDSASVRDGDAPTGAIACGDLISARVTPAPEAGGTGMLVVEQQLVTGPAALAMITLPAKPTLRPTALAAASDGRLALIGWRGDEVEHPLGDGRIEVDLSHEHGFVALVARPEDLAVLAKR